MWYKTYKHVCKQSHTINSIFSYMYYFCSFKHFFPMGNIFDTLFVMHVVHLHFSKICFSVLLYWYIWCIYPCNCTHSVFEYMSAACCHHLISPRWYFRDIRPNVGRNRIQHLSCCSKIDISEIPSVTGCRHMVSLFPHCHGELLTLLWLTLTTSVPARC